MLEGQVLEAYTTLVLLHMVNKLINGIPWRFQLEHQSAHLVVEKSGNCLDLHAVAIINTYFIQVSIRLIIVSESKDIVRDFHILRYIQLTFVPC